MNAVFTIAVGWVSAVYASVFMQTRSYGALLVSLGALLTILTASLGVSREAGDVILLAGRVLFWGGFAVLGTFERDTEVARLRFSSWGEIIMGKVPIHLQKTPVPERMRFVTASLFSGVCAALFFVIGNVADATTFLIIALIFGCYYYNKVRN